MTLMGSTYMGLDSHTPNGRLAAFLRAQYPREHVTKRLADDLRCTPKAAENMLIGHWPNATHWQRIAMRFGRDILEAVFAPDIDAVTARLAGEVRELEEQAERKRALLRQAAGAGLGDQGSVAAPAPNRPAVGPRLQRRRP